MPTVLEVPASPVTDYPLPSAPPRYYFVAGTWGDVICGLGAAQHIMRALDRPKGHLLYYGPDPSIADWLRYQPMVLDVLDLRSPGPVSGIPTDPARRHEWVPAFRSACRVRITAAELWPCHVDFTLRERLPVRRPELATNPAIAVWAHDAIGDIGQRLVLFQPRSETSCLWEGHWPHWHQAAAELLQEWKLIFCGRGEFGGMFGQHPQLINLVNETPSMPHLFALAEACDAVVTTSNALSLYAAARGLPSVVCCNTTHRRPEQFFTRFARGPRSRIVEHWEGMAEFRAAWEGLELCS